MNKDLKIRTLENKIRRLEIRKKFIDMKEEQRIEKLNELINDNTFKKEEVIIKKEFIDTQIGLLQVKLNKLLEKKWEN